MYPGRRACRLSSPRLAGGPYSWHAVAGPRGRVSAGVTSTNGSGRMALESQASGSGTEPLRPPRVFISYAHEPDGAAHSDLVRQLWLFLREHWIDAHADLVAAEQRQDWPLWMADEIRQADYIVVVASPAYRASAQGHSGPSIGRGVQWEARLIRDAFYRDPKALNRFVPLILPGQTIDGVPDFLAPTTTTVYHIHDFTVSGAEPLLRLLHAQPSEVEPPLGERPQLLPNSPQHSRIHASITMGPIPAAERLHHPSAEDTADGLPVGSGRAAHVRSIDSTAFGSDEGGRLVPGSFLPGQATGTTHGPAGHRLCRACRYRYRPSQGPRWCAVEMTSWKHSSKRSRSRLTPALIYWSARAAWASRLLPDRLRTRPDSAIHPGRPGGCQQPTNRPWPADWSASPIGLAPVPPIRRPSAATPSATSATSPIGYGRSSRGGRGDGLLCHRQRR